MVAVLCLVPSYPVGLLTDHRRSWATSGSVALGPERNCFAWVLPVVSVLHYLFNHSLPFIAVIVAVSLNRHVTDYLRPAGIPSRSKLRYSYLQWGIRSKANAIPLGRRTPFRCESEQHSVLKANTVPVGRRTVFARPPESCSAWSGMFSTGKQQEMRRRWTI
jgi:hypothetical protein